MVLALTLVSVLGTPSPTRAASADTAAVMATEFQTWLNRDRVAAGLVPMRPWPTLASLAMTRAGRMAAANVMSHTAAGGNVGNALNAASIPWLGFGEIIGNSNYPWGTQAASNLYGLWKHSPTHAAIMFSSRYNYFGAGFVRRDDGTTWASVVFTESPDHTRPTAYNGKLSRSGTSVSFSWSGRDAKLQTHTAGIRSFDLEYRVDNGAWRLIKNNTTATRITLARRPSGHVYWFRVQAADRRGNLSRWTTPVHVTVP